MEGATPSLPLFGGDLRIKTMIKPQKEQDMLNHLDAFCEVLHQKCRLVYPNLNDDDSKTKIFYPACIVTCKYNDKLYDGRSKSGTVDIPFSLDKSINKILENKLLEEAKLYKTELFKATTYQGEKIYVGSCAEDDAANQLLEADSTIPPTFSLSQIKFTQAIRPRTKQEWPYCRVCQEIFGEEDGNP
jgi:hypothetical protein